MQINQRSCVLPQCPSTCVPFKSMRLPFVSSFAIIAAFAAATHADVIGFNSLNPSEWTYNQSDEGAMASVPDPDTVHITNLGFNQARSIFFNEPQTVAPFTATFTYQSISGPGSSAGRGATFTIHNDPRGPEALGGSGSALGFDGSGLRIENSAAVTFRLNENASGFFTGGIIGTGAPLVSPIDLDGGNPIDVTIEYDGFFLTETLTDTVTLDEYVGSPVIVGDLASIIGSDTAYVGFTASTGSNAGAIVDQFISDFRFTVIPEPATAALLAILGLSGRRSRRR